MAIRSQPNSIKIMEVCKVSPAPQSPAADSAIPKSLPLTFFDLVFLRSSPVERLFFYQFPVSPATFSDSILPKLKQSLSLTLHHFLPLAGNLIWPENSQTPLIEYVDGDGISFTAAESDADFDYVSKAEFCEPTAYHPLVPELAKSAERAQVMGLQVTLFPNHGFSIGIATHHAVADGKISTTFMKSWAQICKIGGDQSEVIKLLYDRSVIKDPKGLGAIYAGKHLEFGGPNNRSLMANWKPQVPSDSVRGILELSRSNLEKLKEFAKIEMAKKNEPPPHTSTFSTTLAYTCACLAKSEGISGQKEVLILIFADCRNRLDPPVPAYFGNCLAVKSALVDPKGLVGKEGFLVALKAIDETIKSFDGEGSFQGAENWVSGQQSLPPYKIYNIAGSPRFGVYGTDFGWGRPIKVDMTNSSGAICLSDTRNGDGGVQISLVLKKQLMEIFASEFAKGLEGLPF